MAALLAGAGMAAMPAARAALDVSPPVLVRSERGIASTLLRARLAAASTWQVRAMRWRQEGGEDLLEPDEDALVSPRVFTLQPGDAQLLRMRLPAPGLHYRLLVEQIDGPEDADAGGVALRFRFSLPVYRAGESPRPVTVEHRPGAECVPWRNDTDAPVWFVNGRLARSVTLLPGATDCVFPQ